MFYTVLCEMTCRREVLLGLRLGNLEPWVGQSRVGWRLARPQVNGPLSSWPGRPGGNLHCVWIALQGSARRPVADSVSGWQQLVFSAAGLRPEPIMGDHGHRAAASGGSFCDPTRRKSWLLKGQSESPHGAPLSPLLTPLWSSPLCTSTKTLQVLSWVWGV